MIETTPQFMGTFNEGPSCRCSDCILNPTTSHGIYMIGVYRFPVMLSKRGNHVHGQSVDTSFTFAGSTASGGHKVNVFPNAANDDPRVWVI